MHFSSVCCESEGEYRAIARVKDGTFRMALRRFARAVNFPDLQLITFIASRRRYTSPLNDRSST